jgi:hypothetical protein
MESQQPKAGIQNIKEERFSSRPGIKRIVKFTAVVWKIFVQAQELNCAGLKPKK